MKVLRDDKIHEVCRPSAWALGKMGRDPTVGLLVRALLIDSGGQVREATVQALGEIAAPRATETLTQALEETQSGKFMSVFAMHSALLADVALCGT